MHIISSLNKSKSTERSGEKKPDLLRPNVRWRGQTKSIGFIYNEQDKKNRFLDIRLGLHFTLCAPNLFGRTADLAKLHDYLLPDVTFNAKRVQRYNVHLARVGQIRRLVNRAGKDGKPINTGAIHTMACASLPGSNDSERLDLLEDYSTIYLMFNRGSYKHLSIKPDTYLKTPRLIKYFNGDVTHGLCTFPVKNSELNRDLYTRLSTQNPNSISGSVANAKAQTPMERCLNALSYLRSINAQTYVVGSFMRPAARATFTIFRSMCRRFLSSKNPYRNRRIEAVTERHGKLFGAWLRDAFDAFVMMCANGTFRIGQGRPRTRVKSPEDVVVGSIMPRVLSTVRRIVKRAGKNLADGTSLFYSFLSDRMRMIRSLLIGGRTCIAPADLSSLLIKHSMLYLKSCNILR